MRDDTDPPPADRVADLAADGAVDAARAALADLDAAAAADRSEAFRDLRALAEDRPATFVEVLPAVAPFLTDDERSVRLAAAKLVVAVVEAHPGAGVPVVEPLADRLADDEEFYYVRARSAEALGYVALDHPDAVASPDLLADLRVGLEFDEPEVREKLAKALECVALGDPGRLRHLTGRLAGYLDDENELVRYHLCTALVVVGCERPEALADAVDRLAARAADPEPHVRGRAAEALGLVAESDADVAVPESDLTALVDDGSQFVADRARFATRDGGEETTESSERAPLGSLASVRESTEVAHDEMTTPDADGECPHCGLELTDQGPPICPRCGAPQ